jgi:hypothetical protein
VAQQQLMMVSLGFTGSSVKEFFQGSPGQQVNQKAAMVSGLQCSN